MYEIFEKNDHMVANQDPDRIVKQKLMAEIQGRIKSAEEGWVNWLEAEIDSVEPI